MKLWACFSQKGLIFMLSDSFIFLSLSHSLIVSLISGSEESYAVLNYAMLEQLSVGKIEPPEAPSSPSSKPTSGGIPRSSHLFRVTLNKDSEGKQEAIVLATESL